MSKKAFMDALAGLSDDDGSSSSSEGEGEEPAPPPAKKKAKQEVDLETLQAHGYTGGLSVLLVPEKREEGPANWAWYVQGTGPGRGGRRGQGGFAAGRWPPGLC